MNRTLLLKCFKLVNELSIVDYQFSTFGLECFKLIIHSRSFVNYHYPYWKGNKNNDFHKKGTFLAFTQIIFY